MRWHFDEGDVSALHDSVGLWVLGSVKCSLLTIAAHPPFPGHGVERLGVLDVQKASGSDYAKVREVSFLSVMHFEWRLHLERLTRSPVPEVRRRHEQLLPHGQWETAV